MLYRQLIDYIKNERQKGQTDDQIRAVLYKNSFTQTDVAEAFAAANPPISQTVSQPKIQVQPQTVNQSQSQSRPQFQPRPRTQSQPQPQSQPKPQNQFRPQAQPQVKPRQQYQPPKPQYQPTTLPPISSPTPTSLLTPPPTPPVIPQPDLQYKPQPQPQSPLPTEIQPQLKQEKSNFYEDKPQGHKFTTLIIGLLALLVTFGGNYFYFQFKTGNIVIALTYTGFWGVIILIGLLLTWLFVIIFRVPDNYFSKTLLFVGVCSLLSLAVEVITLLNLSNPITLVTLLAIFLASIVIVIILFVKIYSVSIGKAIVILILSGIVTAIISGVIFIMVLFAGLFSAADFIKQNIESVVPAPALQNTTPLPAPENVPINSNTSPAPNMAASDCGLSTSFESVTNTNLKTFNFEADTALVCMGQNILNGCVNSQAIVSDSSGAKNLMKIVGTKDNCQIDVVFSKGQTDLLCPVNRLIPVDSQGKTSDGTTIIQLEKEPGKYAAALYQADSLALFDSTAQYCTGTALNKGITVSGPITVPPKNNLPTYKWTYYYAQGSGNYGDGISIAPGETKSITFSDGTTCSISAEQIVSRKDSSGNSMVVTSRKLNCPTNINITQPNSVFDGVTFSTNEVGCIADTNNNPQMGGQGYLSLQNTSKNSKTGVVLITCSW